MKKVIVGLFFILTLLCCPVHAEKIVYVITASPSWDTFTNRDGTGLYHEILREVFGLHNVTVEHVYSKSGRAEVLVTNKQADMMTCADSARQGLVLGRYPMYESDFHVFFNKERIGKWQGAESLRDKVILGQPSFYCAENFSVPVKLQTVPSGEQAVGMILLGRADFYVDDKKLIMQSIDEVKKPFVMDMYAIEKAGQRSYHPLFNTDERGKAIMKMYDDGIIKLHKVGKLRPIYKKWGHQYPDFDQY